MPLDLHSLEIAARDARGLAIDAVVTCRSGHLGLPLGAAEIGAVLFGYALSICPEEPKWINRDRFILSAGHGSMFLYSWLHLCGFAISLEDLKKFRSLRSVTPGHPEFRDTPGVEATTGPLGQGVANALGYAISAKMAEARFNTRRHCIFNHHIIVLAGDGCLQEGVTQESSALAGHLGLDNLILIYDSNDVTLDSLASVTQSEDTEARYRALGWEVYRTNGHDLQEFFSAFEKAKATSSGKPQLIIARTLIGKGIPEVSGSSKAHGEGGARFSREARRRLGLPEETFYVSVETRTYFARHKERLRCNYEKWVETYKAWRSTNHGLATVLDSSAKAVSGDDLLASVPTFDSNAVLATRKAGSTVLQPVAKELPLLVSGSADLHGSTLNYIQGGGDFSRENRLGRNLYFGIREHAMCGALNGIAYDGIFHASGATFLVFSDYGRPSIRLAAISQVPVVYLFTHDSIGVGEDGPTHQPVETLAALRCIPNLDVIRPADPEETAGAFAAAFSRRDGPTLLALSRQNVPNLHNVPVQDRRDGPFLGGYVAKRETTSLDLILLASGSELQLALQAAEQLGRGTRVVSMPCFERFERQLPDYQEEVLPKSVRQRLSVEAGVSDPWFRYIGLDGKAISVRQFGLSAPGAVVLQELGITTAAVIEAAQSLASSVLNTH
ncbi:transketolase family protein [Candidatus Xiphinematobacter sp. Idaho Grape]|uniref:transketolase family protein n=1 Tax=Candidatus Xiphinematobacter sp. Idaho Grape TaxID=1704307 RepID=UPI0007828702|nr:transketolase [Candidatus Xiphinematobacter sp. Idaho Grape]